MEKHINLIGQRFGYLVVVEKTNTKYLNTIIWLCRCDCGNFKEIRGDKLKCSKIKSCGCSRRTKVKNQDSIRKTKLYKVWISMKQRCYNPNVERFQYYGGKGIKVCDEWLNDFQTFKKWTYENGYGENSCLSIDRVDSNKNYDPSNCQWITRAENSKKAINKIRQENGKFKKAL